MGVRNTLLILVLGLVLFCGGCATSDDHRLWASQYGGVATHATTARVDAIVQRLQTGLAGPPLRAHVLQTNAISAFSFKDGSIYVTRGLLDSAEDDEVAAAVAHELGHLLSDGYVKGPAALSGSDQGLDTEAEADALGCAVLKMHGVAPGAMVRMLERVVADKTCHRRGDALWRRIRLLQEQTAAADKPK